MPGGNQVEMTIFLLTVMGCMLYSLVTGKARIRDMQASIQEEENPKPSKRSGGRRRGHRDSSTRALRDWLLKRGWHGTARHCEGVLLFPGGAIDAAAELRAGNVEMFFKDPPRWLLKHRKFGSCLQLYDNGWYRVHQHYHFTDLHQAILGAESFVNACHPKRARAA